MMSLAPPSVGSANRNRKTTQNRRSGADSSTSTNALSAKVNEIRHIVGQNIWLPDSPATFAFFMVTISVLCGGLFLHINLSAQITRTQLEVQELERGYYEIERENAEIVSQIAIATSMFDIYGRATALGFVPISDRHKNFVAAADIQIPQPVLVAAAVQGRPASMTVADAIAANASILTGSSGLSAADRLASSNSTEILAERTVLSYQATSVEAQLGLSDSSGLGAWLKNWWENNNQ